MKDKKTIILLMILLVIIGMIGGLAIYQKLFAKVSPDEILKELFNAKSYSTDVTYVVKNARGQFKEEGKIEYFKEKNIKFIQEDKEQIFENDKIIINYIKDNKTYEVGKEYDNFYKYMFINELPQFMKYENYVNHSIEEENGQKVIKLEFFLLSGNDNFHKEVLYVDLIKKVPIKASIYDKKGEERINIEYRNFEKDRKNK